MPPDTEIFRKSLLITQTTQLSNRMNKLWYSHSVEHHSVIKRNELWIHTTKIVLKNMLSEKS